MASQTSSVVPRSHHLSCVLNCAVCHGRPTRCSTGAPSRWRMWRSLASRSRPARTRRRTRTFALSPVLRVRDPVVMAVVVVWCLLWDVVGCCLVVVRVLTSTCHSPTHPSPTLRPAFIAGWGLDEALARSHAYADAGADAILMHSAKSDPSEIQARARWRGGLLRGLVRGLMRELMRRVKWPTGDPQPETRFEVISPVPILPTAVCSCLWTTGTRPSAPWSLFPPSSTSFSFFFFVVLAISLTLVPRLPLP